MLPLEGRLAEVLELLLDGRLADEPAVLLLVEGRLLTVGRLLVVGRMLPVVLLLEGLLALLPGRDVVPFTVGREAEPLKELLLWSLVLALPVTLLLC